MLVASYFMDIDKYQKDKYFERNRAIYVLHTVDELPLEQIAVNFDLDTQEIEKIISTHSRYEEELI